MRLPYPITETPPNAGVRVEDQTGRTLHQAEMYQRNNFPIPVPPESFEIVEPDESTRRLTATDLGAMEQRSIVVVLECAGNGRTLMEPTPGGTPWDLGGASTIEISGVPLAAVLSEPTPNTEGFVFTGADRGHVQPEGLIAYQFFLDVDLATSDVPMLVTRIGGEPLTREHGAPVRLVVPGHYAMKSVKWLTRIEPTTRPFTGHFVNKYRYFGDAAHDEGAPVGPIAVRSVITSPLDGQKLPAGDLEVTGAAWSGHGAIAAVMVSTDSGRTWNESVLGTPVSTYAPTPWSITSTTAPGEVALAARAVDVSGNVQPLDPVWNANGYANNVVQTVVITTT